jgi:endonuclease YncB( thermonuclease family)
MTDFAPAYRYRATAVAVHDGDTFTARVDVGFRTTVELELRIADVYAPELNEPRGQEARGTLSQLLAVGPLIVETRKAKRTGRDLRSFERYVADVWTWTGLNVAEALIAAGVATRLAPA